MNYGRVLFVAFLAAGLVAATGAAAPPDTGRLTVTDVAVSPSNPTVADTVTFEVTLRNSAGSPAAIDVETVRVRDGDGEVVAAAGNVGTLSQGDTLTIPVAAEFETAGEKNLVVVAEGVDGTGNRTVVRRPVPLVVERAPPQLSAEVQRPVAGATSNVTVTVANPTTAAVRNLTVTAAGEGFAAVEGRASLPDLDPGETATVPLRVRPDETGERELRLRLSYTTASGRAAATTLTRTVSVAPADRDVGLRVEPTAGDDGQPTPAGVGQVLGGGTLQSDDDGDDGGADRADAVSVTVTNFGNAPAEDVVLVPVGTDELARRSVAGSLSPGESASVTVDLSSVRTDTTVEFRVDYRMAGESGSVSRPYEVRPAQGRVELTGLNLSMAADGTLELSGNVGNVGDRAVTGVVVEVGQNRYAGPAYPRRSYFVGTIQGSEFAPFELTAAVDATNVSAVPVRVRYAVAGSERERVVEVPFDDRLRPADGEQRGLSGVVPGLAALVAAVPVGWLVARRVGGL